MPWEEVEIQLQGTAPGPGCKAALWMPDPEASLHNRPEYAITIAYGATPLLIDGYLVNVPEEQE
mgnify:CR=1 FL=1